MRLLVLHMRYSPDPTGTGPLVTQLCRGLAAGGDRVTAITTVAHYAGAPEEREPFGRLFHSSVEDGVRVIRTAGFRLGAGGLIGRSVDYLLYMLLAAFAALREPKPEIVLCIAPPITVAVSGWLVGSLRGSPVVFNAQDIWPDGLVGMGRLRPGLLLSGLRRFERWVYGFCKSISVISPGMRDNLVAKGVPAEKIAVIPNWADPQEIRPMERASRFRRELGLDDRFVVLFAGNLGYAAGLETALEAADLLRADARILLLFVGEGSAKPGLRERATQMSLENVRFVGTQPRSRLGELYGSADVGLVCLRPAMGLFSLPSKVYSILASGRPVLAAVPEDSEVRRLVDEAGCGSWVPAGDARALAEEIQRLAGSPLVLAEWGRKARRYAEETLSPSESIARYRAWLADAAGGL